MTTIVSQNIQYLVQTGEETTNLCFCLFFFSFSFFKKQNKTKKRQSQQRVIKSSSGNDTPPMRVSTGQHSERERKKSFYLSVYTEEKLFVRECVRVQRTNVGWKQGERVKEKERLKNRGLDGKQSYVYFCWTSQVLIGCPRVLLLSTYVQLHLKLSNFLFIYFLLLDQTVLSWWTSYCTSHI